MILSLDRVFAHYRLQRRLGGGGMGEVYLATTDDGRYVALKLIPIRDDSDSRDIVAAERVGAQLQQLFGASDPHVPAVHAVGEHDGYFFIEMEYIDGHDLEELIASGMAPGRAAGIAREVALFLERAHGFNANVGGREFGALVHADLKPRNIRINSDDAVKVLDFGISKGLSLTGRLTTAAFGSRLYMSPEWLDTGRLDRHVDLWALGVVLYEMLAGHLPYKTESARDLELQLRDGRPPLPLPETCPVSLQRVVLKMLASALPARYESAAAIRADLDAWLEGRSTSADEEWARRLTDEATRRTPRPPTADAPALPVAADATRRTVPPPILPTPDGESTTRLAPGPVAPPPFLGTTDTTALPRPAPSLTRAQVWLRRAFMAMVLGLVVNEYAACRAASTLRAELPTREAADLDDAWLRYQAVRTRSLLGMGYRPASGAMREALVTNAERIIADFRHDRPTVRERQWQQARTWLAGALRLDAGDAALTARLRYCEGQLSRIDGEARMRTKRQEADRLLHDAVSRFEEATRLDRSWPDPWLGLLRTYIYGLDDPARAVEALNEAERRGHRAGRREFVQLGESHFALAERSRRECDKLPAEQQCGCLQRADASYRQSVSWFERVTSDADASRSLVRAHDRQLAAASRIYELGCTADLPGTDAP